MTSLPGGSTKSLSQKALRQLVLDLAGKIASFEQELSGLRTHNQTLQAEVERLRLDNSTLRRDNQALKDEIARLKKRKLRLKDEIQRLQDQLIPDIIA